MAITTDLEKGTKLPQKEVAKEKQIPNKDLKPRISMQEKQYISSILDGRKDKKANTILIIGADFPSVRRKAFADYDIQPTEKDWKTTTYEVTKGKKNFIVRVMTYNSFVKNFSKLPKEIKDYKLI